MIFDNEQKRAIKHLNGPLLLIAGPGAGKTATMVERLHNMIIESEINPDRILVITFSRAAATEMKSRFYKRVNNLDYDVHFGTFHSIFLKMLKHYFGNTFNFKLIEEYEKNKILTMVLKEHGFENILSDFVDEFLLDVSLYKNSGMEFASYKPFSCDFETFVSIYKGYEKKLRKRQIFDFDDIILMTNEMLMYNKDFRTYWQSRFDYVLIDEFQDINSLQFNAVKILVDKHDNIFAVGDEDQSIYGFRGSNPDIMLNFQKEFSNALVLYLVNNYRSGKEIVDTSQRLIKHNKSRYNKTINSASQKESRISFLKSKTEDEQLNSIKSIVITLDKDFAILCRTNSEKNYFQQELSKVNIDVTVLTMHESKGLEFDAVLIPNVIEGNIPFVHKIYGCDCEEERRVFYVAITRAKKNLFISYIKVKKNIRKKKSSFIKELKKA